MKTAHEMTYSVKNSANDRSTKDSPYKGVGSPRNTAVEGLDDDAKQRTLAKKMKKSTYERSRDGDGWNRESLSIFSRGNVVWDDEDDLSSTNNSQAIVVA